MTFAFIAESVGEWPVAWRCNARDVPESGYHARAARSPSPAEQRRGVLVAGVGTGAPG